MSHNQTHAAFVQNKDSSGHLPCPRPPTGQVFRRMSMDTSDVAAHTQLNNPAMLEGSLFSNAAANPNALRCQSFNLDDLPASQVILTRGACQFWWEPKRQRASSGLF